jgi:hypothetical protein
MARMRRGARSDVARGIPAAPRRSAAAAYPGSSGRWSIVVSRLIDSSGARVRWFGGDASGGGDGVVSVGGTLTPRPPAGPAAGSAVAGRRGCRPPSTAPFPTTRTPNRPVPRCATACPSPSARSSSGEGVEEVERRCLAGEVHREPHPAVSLGDQHDDRHEGLAGEEHRHEPPRDDLAPGQSEQGRHDVETVGDRVEQLTDTRDQSVGSGDLAVEVVGEPRGHEQHDGQAVTLGEDGPEEYRDPDQPKRRERVRHGEHPIAHLLIGPARRHGRNCMSCGGAAPHPP